MFPTKGPTIMVENFSEELAARVAQAYDRYCELVKNPKSPEEIAEEGGWPMKLIEALCWQVHEPADSLARVVAFLEKEGGNYEYDKGVLNGLRLALGVFTNQRPTLDDPPRKQGAAKPEPATEPEEPEPEPGEEDE